MSNVDARKRLSDNTYNALLVFSQYMGNENFCVESAAKQILAGLVEISDDYGFDAVALLKEVRNEGASNE